MPARIAWIINTLSEVSGGKSSERNAATSFIRGATACNSADSDRSRGKSSVNSNTQPSGCSCLASSTALWNSRAVRQRKRTPASRLKPLSTSSVRPEPDSTTSTSGLPLDSTDAIVRLSREATPRLDGDG